MNQKLFFLLFSFLLVPFLIGNSYAQITSGGFGDSPFERDFGDVKFLDAYFGTLNEKIEVESGDSNVPFTVVFANVGTQDITGIKGQLSLPLGFSASDGPGSIIKADSDSNSLAGENFHLTFFVNLDKNVSIQQYPGTVKVDYSRLRESGVRTAFEDFQFKVTGDSVINVRALETFLTSLRTNNVIIEIANDGTAPISSVDIVASNTQTELASTTTSTTNVENVVILESNWDVGNIEPKSTRHLTATVYVPEGLKDDTLRIPLSISYYNAHGDQHIISKIVDFYIKGLIELTIFNVDVIELSGTQMVIGEIINEGNEDGLFGFVSIEPRGDSNIKPNTQFIDEIEIDAPVPFNIPIEFDGEPEYGEHDITITVRYKDGVRDELFVIEDTTIFVNEPTTDDESGLDSSMIIIPVIIVIAAGIFIMRRRKKTES
ncbi:COG1361 S-layer family protein [Nitrosopumilus sp.]|uniref:COG1361 S-layer family protein n=1 Tax=Nitrosopumilus sp. TaxID=2024843 RepID=UPI003D0FD8ED